MKKSEILLHPNDHKNIRDWQKIFKFLDENLDYQNLNSILELGAGMGNISTYILEKNPKISAVCEDINPKYLEIINQRNPKIKTLLHDINSPFPFENEKFDLVICMGTLHYKYIKDPIKVLKEMIRVSRKYILVDFFSKYSFFTIYEKICYPKYQPRRFSSSTLLSLFKNLNLKELDKIGTRTIFPKTFPFSGKTTIFLLEKL